MRPFFVIYTTVRRQPALTLPRVRVLAEGNTTWGVNGETGELVDMKELKIWEPLAVKLQTVKTAVEVSKSPAVVLRSNSSPTGEE